MSRWPMRKFDTVDLSFSKVWTLNLYRRAHANGPDVYLDVFREISWSRNFFYFFFASLKMKVLVQETFQNGAKFEMVVPEYSRNAGSIHFMQCSHE